MAFAVRITGLRSIYDPEALKDKPAFEMEPSWWPTDELKNDKRFLKTRDLGSYDDYTVDLPVAEVKELFERFRPLAKAFTTYDNRMQQSLIELERVLNSEEYKYFEVCVFEWESGY